MSLFDPNLLNSLVAMLAFIFDIDGTLVDSNELHVDSWDSAFRQFGKQFPREKLRAQIGKGSDQYLPESDFGRDRPFRQRAG
jgi:beta-phosphoglucomutase-like phosphatase (HAD superfamily)